MDARPRDHSFSWPTFSGIGGLSRVALEALPEDRSGSRACAALVRWSHTITGGPDTAIDVGDFPFTDILPHYQAVGRIRVSEAFLKDLRNALGALADDARSPRHPAWLLAGWLHSAADQENGDYESFLGEELLARAVALHGGDEDGAYDALTAVLVADLAAYEASASPLTEDGRERSIRISGASRALAHLDRLAPGAPVNQGDLAELRAALAAHQSGALLAEIAHRAAASLLGVAAPPFRFAVETSMLPITPLHDEYMFLRSVQLFEIVYWQVVRCLRRAADGLLHGDLSRVCGELTDAASRVEATSLLYRVITTMPREVFAIIRGLTDGRSAIQSKPYRMVEMLSAPRTLSPDILDKIPSIEIPGLTLQDAFEQQSARLDGAAIAPTAEAMVRLDKAWRAMKRTHWGITRKIIGDVSGTGGTAGSSYLEASSRVPLFPLFHGPGDPDGGNGESDGGR